MDCRAAVNLRFGPNESSVAANDALHRGQTDANARELGRAVQALKRSEQRTGVCHIETRAVVAHARNGLAFAVRPADINQAHPTDPRWTWGFDGPPDY